MNVEIASHRAGTERSTEASVVNKVAWRFMPLIMVCYFFAFFDRINIGPKPSYSL
jgi:hypothetical protein